MRSRYTAYVRRDEAYLLRTWKTSHRPASLDLDDTVWLGLEVLSTDAGGVDDARGTVEFVAYYDGVGGAVQALRESSRFARVAGAWVYVDGEAPRERRRAFNVHSD
jgi:SEC-C motif-containing protein